MMYRLLLILYSCLLPLTLQAESLEEQLWHLRNLGKAFYENSATQYEAVGQFKKALDLAPNSARERINYGLSLMRSGKIDEGIAQLIQAQAQNPDIPHTWFNLGIAYKQQSLYDKAIEQLEGMLARVPDEAITHYNLGVLYKINKRSVDALAHLEQAAALDQNLAGPHFQLATAYRQQKRLEESQQAMTNFKRIKKEQAGAAVSEDLEWSFYSEIYETINPIQMPATPPQAELLLTQKVLPSFASSGLGLRTLDINSDGMVELLGWSTNQVRILQFTADDVQATDLSNIFPDDLRQFINGDFNNDGYSDLCVIHKLGATLYTNNAGNFDIAPIELAQGDFNNALWLDYDHDYDLDLFLLGASSYLLRNNGDSSFSDYSDHFPFIQGHALAAARIDLIADTQGMDLVVSYTNRPGVLYRDRLAGHYEAQELDILSPGTIIQAFDFDNDGWTDLTAQGKEFALLHNNHQAGFTLYNSIDTSSAEPVLFADLENRGISELVIGKNIFRNTSFGN